MFFEENVDIKKNYILSFDYSILDILLKDRTTNKNIIWATDIYEHRSPNYSPSSPIIIEQITGRNGNVIKPRTKKSKLEQNNRIKKNAEVYTPSWVCNMQNNIADHLWFGYENVFNKEKGKEWISKKSKIKFTNNIKWQDYVSLLKIEISCGEAPYIVSRYDTTTGNLIPINDRIGFLDRKLRIIDENVNEKDEWIKWVEKAYKSVYGYEWQGDSLLIARENLLYTFLDYYTHKFNEIPSHDDILKIATIISWNIFQMDGLKGVIPYSCHNGVIINYTLFGEERTEFKCTGCEKNNINNHNGIYVKIMNWETGRKIKFVSLLKKGR